MRKIYISLFLFLLINPMAVRLSAQATYADHSVLASGKWYKVGIPETGVYRLSYSDFSSLGLDVDRIDPKNIRIYHNGGGMLNELNDDPFFDDLIEIPIVVVGESDGRFDRDDYVLFYARGPVTWKYNTTAQAFVHCQNAYADASCAFITVDLGSGQRIKGFNPTGEAAETIDEFLDYQVYDDDKYNIINAGRTYYGDIIDGNGSLTYDFEFKNVVTDRLCSISVNLAGRNFNPASFQLSLNDRIIKTFNIAQTSSNSQNPFANEASGIYAVPVSDSRLKVGLKHIGVQGTTSIGYVDYVAVNAWRKLAFVGPEMKFRNPEASDEGKVYRYQISNATSALQVWDVTDSICPVKVSGQLSGSVFSFKVRGNLKNEFIAFDGTSYPAPSLLGAVANQDLHGQRECNYLMVVYPDFLAQAERLKAIHAQYDPDLNILIVTPEQIYNEFSCGAQDVTAIRNYCRMLYHQTHPLRYLLLFGDASFDYKNRNGMANFVPTYETINGSDIRVTIATDDYFGFMDAGEGALKGSVPDIGVGRFPVSTLEQAANMVDKVERYLEKSENTMQPWRNTITFMCDDAEADQFIDHSEMFAERIMSTGGENLVVDKIYLDAYNQTNTPSGQTAPDFNNAVNNRMEKGTLVLNYVGHGGEVQLASERILQRSDVNLWHNGPKYPLMITGTCEFSRYDDHDRTSLGEYAFLSQYGGMVAMFTTSRVTFGPDNKRFILAVYDHLFQMENGERLRLGDVFKLAKPNGYESERRYVFFGDPALRLPLPKWTVETVSMDDTLKALQPATIEGVVKNLHGDVATDFNGVVHVSVYDKETTYVTKGDENTPIREFNLRQSVVFNGKAQVVNGRFSVSFIVPRDISYRFGNGMVSYYATNYEVDASGKYEDFAIGGFYDNAVQDENPPEVQLFIDDERFVSGGITGDSPTLIAYISDENGINTTGAGIGHDIVATLSGADNRSYVLNDFFEANIGDQGSGVVTYKMQNLAEGDYTLTLKVWDIFNNSGTMSVDFRVTSSDLMVLEDPLCAPNPVFDEACFSFGHNQTGRDMDVQICIYDLMGRQVTVLHEQVAGTSTRANPIRWDGRAGNGRQLPPGVYVYCITATNDLHETSSITSKFVIAR